MKNRILLAVAALAVFGLYASTVTNASAFPTEAGTCVTCHSGPDVPVLATLASSTTTSATYNVSAPNATAIAVFDGASKLTTIDSNSGQFTVAVGKTYTVYAVQGPTDVTGVGSTTVSPTAPAPTDTTAPTTSSNVKASYVGTATVTLTAVDNPGGSGVAHTYHALDGAAQVEGTTVTTSVLGSHTLTFWSVDVSGNVEAANPASFVVTAQSVVTPKCTLATNVGSVKRNHAVRLSGAVAPATVGARPVLYVQKPGTKKWVRVSTLTAGSTNGAGGATWKYSYTPKAKGTYRFQVRFAGMTSRTVKLTVR